MRKLVAKLVVSLQILPVDAKGKGVTTYHEAARALRALARDFDSEAAGAELSPDRMLTVSGIVFGLNEKDVVGAWRVIRGSR